MEATIEYKYRATKLLNTDPTYRAKVNQWARESAVRQKARYPDGYREKQRIYMKDRYNNDPEFRERKLAMNRAYIARKKAEKIAELALSAGNLFLSD
jgi:hypothetical protein